MFILSQLEPLQRKRKVNLGCFTYKLANKNESFFSPDVSYFRSPAECWNTLQTSIYTLKQPVGCRPINQCERHAKDMYARVSVPQNDTAVQHSLTHNSVTCTVRHPAGSNNYKAGSTPRVPTPASSVKSRLAEADMHEDAGRHERDEGVVAESHMSVSLAHGVQRERVLSQLHVLARAALVLDGEH